MRHVWHLIVNAVAVVVFLLCALPLMLLMLYSIYSSLCLYFRKTIKFSSERRRNKKEKKESKGWRLALSITDEIIYIYQVKKPFIESQHSLCWNCRIVKWDQIWCCVTETLKWDFRRIAMQINDARLHGIKSFWPNETYSNLNRGCDRREPNTQHTHTHTSTCQPNRSVRWNWPNSHYSYCCFSSPFAALPLPIFLYLLAPIHSLTCLCVLKNGQIKCTQNVCACKCEHKTSTR